MRALLSQPLDSGMILKKKKRIRTELLKEKSNFMDLRVAILGGSTTAEIKNILEIFLLDSDIKPMFYESEYNKWYEDCVFENKELDKFNPQIVIFHTTFVNIMDLPDISDSRSTVMEKVDALYEKFKSCWDKLREKYSCVIIQNNFELPNNRICGNMDFVNEYGYVNFVNLINNKFVEYARECRSFYINDINYLSAYLGLKNWYDKNLYHMFKFAFSYEVIPHYCYNLATVIKASLGKSKKCIVLDLDNTLWGGVIGDDGINNISLGHETALGESYLDFQKYLLNLKNRGIILAVCSKNEVDIAKTGFAHPDSILQLDDFTAFYANWEPKHINIINIAKDINIGLDSLVFIDDNPVERQIVREHIPEVVVPEVIDGDPMSYINAIENGKYFEQLVISNDDLKRNQTYAENIRRNDLEKTFSSYEDFLKSLEMKAEIKSFESIYLDRITQLTNKTNQFNLTTRRYTRSEIDEIADSEMYLKIYGRLSDKFGDNGLVSVIIGRIEDETLHIDLWLMSCRVLKRDFEFAMFYELERLAKQRGLKYIRGYYFKTKKNSMVNNLFETLGFKLLVQNGEDSEWIFNIDSNDKQRKIIAIEVSKE